MSSRGPTLSYSKPAAFGIDHLLSLSKRDPNEYDGFWCFVKSWPLNPTVLGKPYRPGPGPVYQILSLVVKFSKWCMWLLNLEQ